MDLPYIKQVCLELIKGGFILVSVGVGGVYANQALEKFKRRQDLRAEVTKRQYSALLSLFESLTDYEKRITRKAFDSRAERRGKEPDPEVDRWMGEQLNEGEWMAMSQGLLLGPEITKDALLFVKQAWGIAFELTRWNTHFDKEATELNATRERLRSHVPKLEPME